MAEISVLFQIVWRSALLVFYRPANSGQVSGKAKLKRVEACFRSSFNI
jgi:hypothetical protein